MESERWPQQQKLEVWRKEQAGTKVSALEWLNVSMTCYVSHQLLKQKVPVLVGAEESQGEHPLFCRFYSSQVGILSALIGLRGWTVSPLGWETFMGKRNDTKWSNLCSCSHWVSAESLTPWGLQGEGVIALLCETFCLWWYYRSSGSVLGKKCDAIIWILVRINRIPTTALSSWFFFLSHIKPSL